MIHGNSCAASQSGKQKMFVCHVGMPRHDPACRDMPARRIKCNKYIIATLYVVIVVVTWLKLHLRDNSRSVVCPFFPSIYYWCFLTHTDIKHCNDHINGFKLTIDSAVLLSFLQLKRFIWVKINCMTQHGRCHWSIETKKK